MKLMIQSILYLINIYLRKSFKKTESLITQDRVVLENKGNANEKKSVLGVENGKTILEIKI